MVEPPGPSGQGADRLGSKLADGMNWRNAGSFWLAGLLNNAAYVIMIAFADEISAGAIGLVYICAIGPTILVKATGPYWFHIVPYNTRLGMVAALMSVSYACVAFGTTMGAQLLGVAITSFQGGLGEASVLALASRYPTKQMVSMWSSGTGAAGVVGYAWVAVLHMWGGLSAASTLMLANLTAVGWMAVFGLMLPPPDTSWSVIARLPSALTDAQAERQRMLPDGPPPQPPGSERLRPRGCSDSGDPPTSTLEPGNTEQDRSLAYAAPAIAPPMSVRERFRRSLGLWPYTIPLVLVYAAEYALQSGPWTAMVLHSGGDVRNVGDRHEFYVIANWTYQAGVFVSRSSGLLFQADRVQLWIMPLLQCAWLAFFYGNALWHFWVSPTILLPCFCTGLLGGAVYVNAFTIMSHEVEARYLEFSLAAASLADSLGIIIANVLGILLQGCLFKANGVEGARYQC